LLGSLALPILSGCELDERPMLEEETLAAGSGGSTVSSGGAPNGSAGRAANAGQGGEFAIPDCVFVGKAMPEGCDSLVENPGFSDDVEGWAAENPKILVGWYPEDATDNAESGSIAVNNTLYGDGVGTVTYGAWQCVPVTAGGVYDFAADVFIPEGQDPTGMAGINVYYFDSEDCEGGNKYSFSTDLVTEVGTWVPVRATDVAPGSAHSMFIRLVPVKQFEPLMFRAHFDNVLVRLR
jgi:hypothetical protein